MILPFRIPNESKFVHILSFDPENRLTFYQVRLIFSHILPFRAIVRERAIRVRSLGHRRAIRLVEEAATKGQAL